MYLCNSVLDMLKHKFTHYTNTKLRTVIKCTHKMGFLLSHLIQLLLLCSVLLLNLVLFVSKKCSALLSNFYGRQACWRWQGLCYTPPVTLCLCQEVGLQAQPLRILYLHLPLDLLCALWTAVSTISPLLQVGQT